MRKRRDRTVESEIAALAASPDVHIDTSEIPEVVDWSAAIQGRFDPRKNKHVRIGRHSRTPKVARNATHSQEARASSPTWLDDFLDFWPLLRLEEPSENDAGAYAYDEEHIQRLRSGDPAAVDHFFCYFKPRLQASLRQHGFASPILEDIIHEVLVRCVSGLRGTSLKPERLRNFVYSLCEQVIIDQSRRRMHVLTKMGVTLPNTLGHLTAAERRVLRALIDEGLSEDKICERFGIKPGSLRRVFSQAKKSSKHWRARSPSQKPEP